MQRMTRLMLVIVACLVSITAGSALAYTGDLKVPDEGNTQILTLNDGSKLFGKVIEVGETEIKFQSQVGEVTIEIDNIKKIEEVSESAMKGGEYWFPNPNQTRMMIGPTARTLKAGKGYLFNMWIFFAGAGYGVTDNFTVAGGVSIFPDADEQLFFLFPKYGFPVSEKVDLAATLMVFSVWEETLYLGMGTMTYGTGDASVTCGLGFAHNGDEMSENPGLNFGGEYRMSRRTSLVGESWIIPTDEGETGALVMGAVRFFGEQMAVSLGFAYASDSDDDDGYDYDDDDTNVIPYLDFVWNF